MRRSFAEAARTRTFVRVISAASVLLVMAVGLTGCPKNEEKSKVGETCLVGADCQDQLLCRGGICVRSQTSDAGPGGGDATDADATDGGGGETIEPEDYFISYVLNDQAEDTGELQVYSTADEEVTTVSPDGMNCQSNCWLTRNMEYFVHRQNAGSSKFDVYVSEVGSDLKAKGMGSAWVTGVTDVVVKGNYLTYQKSGASYYRKIKDGEEKVVTSESGLEDVYVDPETGVKVTFKVGQSSQTMTVNAGRLDGEGESSYELGGANFQTDSGAYFSGNVLTASSRDGNIVAFTTEAPNNYQLCARAQENDAWSSEACDGDRLFKCGHEQFCTRLETSVRFIDMENRDNLGEKCAGEGTCGPIHECYVPSPKRLDDAKCIPGRTVLGVPDTNQGPMRQTSGCQIVNQDDSIDFTRLRGPISFDDEGNAYIVGMRDRECLGDFDTVNSNIVKMDPTKSDYEMIEGLDAEKKFSPDDCWNAEDARLDLENCSVYVQNALVSPGGNELAYTATNPNTSTPRQADRFVSLWHILRDGSERWFTGDKNTPATDVVKFIRVHPGE